MGWYTFLIDISLKYVTSVWQYHVMILIVLLNSENVEYHRHSSSPRTWDQNTSTLVVTTLGSSIKSIYIIVLVGHSLVTAMGLRWDKHDEMQQNMYNHIQIGYSPIIQLFIVGASQYTVHEIQRIKFFDIILQIHVCMSPSLMLPLFLIRVPVWIRLWRQNMNTIRFAIFGILACHETTWKLNQVR
jgi:hypothetical protein